MKKNGMDKKQRDAKKLEEMVEDIKKGFEESISDESETDGLNLLSLTYDEKIVGRVATVSGHMTAIRNMIDDHREVEDVLNQLTAVEKSILKLKREIIKNHIYKNVMDDKDLTYEEKLSYINELLNKFMK